MVLCIVLPYMEVKLLQCEIILTRKKFGSLVVHSRQDRQDQSVRSKLQVMVMDIIPIAILELCMVMNIIIIPVGSCVYLNIYTGYITSGEFLLPVISDESSH